ncbi:BQ2448_3566 [Microbotryum intermedium]|uniref:BQ2448_3566 protein n=1 Tax=Microbotryum intermedium TaxID=269621 RepID=A0A238FG00_9BASI|nr:BQ2448_3566 [Microbotryum intermedium]
MNRLHIVKPLFGMIDSMFCVFFCMKLIANLQDEKIPYGTKGDATQCAR